MLRHSWTGVALWRFPFQRQEQCKVLQTYGLFDWLWNAATKCSGGNTNLQARLTPQHKQHQDLHTSIRTPSSQATTWKESDNNKSNVQNTAVNMIFFFTVALNV